MNRGEIIYICNCYGLPYNILGIFDRFEDDFFYFATPWKERKELRLAKCTRAEFIAIPWSKKIYKTIFYLEFYDQKINKKIMRWFARLNYAQLLTHPNRGLRSFAKQRIAEEAERNKFKGL